MDKEGKIEGDDAWWSPKQLADYLYVTEKQLGNLRTQGFGGPEWTKVGHLVRYNKKIVLAWLAEQSVTSTAQSKLKADLARSELARKKLDAVKKVKCSTNLKEPVQRKFRRKIDPYPDQPDPG